MKLTNPRWTRPGFMIVAFTFLLGAQEEYRYPRPDFSTMERWYEIRKWDYNESSQSMTILVKPKVAAERRPRQFVVKFLDRGGLDVEQSPATFCCIMSINRDNAVEKIQATMPRESQMDKVKWVVIFRTRDDGTNVR